MREASTGASGSVDFVIDELKGVIDGIAADDDADVAAVGRFDSSEEDEDSDREVEEEEVWG